MSGVTADSAAAIANADMESCNTDMQAQDRYEEIKVVLRGSAMRESDGTGRGGQNGGTGVVNGSSASVEQEWDGGDSREEEARKEEEYARDVERRRRRRVHLSDVAANGRHEGQRETQWMRRARCEAATPSKKRNRQKWMDQSGVEIKKIDVDNMMEK
ncbi:hypothetical protein Tco_0630927 [Tanacetum coccineum]